MENEERQFELEMSAEEKYTDSLLSEALHIHAPEGLSDRVGSVSQEQLTEACNEVLERKLDDAFEMAVPENLSERCFANSVHELRSDQPTVIAKVDHSVKWHELALAACILFAVSAAIWVSNQPTNETPQGLHVATNEVLSVEEEELLLEDLNLSEYTYLADTREIAFADIAVGLEGLRDDIELWQYGLLSE